MKKITIVLAAIVMLFTTSAFAYDASKLNPVVKAAFAKDFKDASQVVWELNSGFYFADFMVNGKMVSAAYNEDGELLGTSRRVNFDQLPLNVSLALKQKYSDYDLGRDALELTYDGQTSYYITAVNSKQTLSLKCSSSGDISVEQRTKNEQ